MNSLSLPTRANADLIEAMYRTWLDNPDAVDLDRGARSSRASRSATTGGTPTLCAAALEAASGEAVPIVDSPQAVRTSIISINAYRGDRPSPGAPLDPLSDPPAAARPSWSSRQFNLSEADLDISRSTSAPTSAAAR